MKFNSGSYSTVIGFKPDEVHIASAVTVSTVTAGGVSATCPLCAGVNATSCPQDLTV